MEKDIPQKFVPRKCQSKESCSKMLIPSTTEEEDEKKARRRLRAAQRRLVNQIPDEIRNNVQLQQAIAQLPSNYNFEIQKTIWRIKQKNASRVALQFPEGLLMYSCVISDIIERFAQVDTIILGDATYGACCVDDLTSKALAADFLVHYGHSCLVPIDITNIDMLYVFVDISIDVDHFVGCVKATFPKETKIALMGTIQFVSSLCSTKSKLETYFDDLLVPQARPLSAGEVLGCTSPSLSGRDALIFLADGRFHLEASMIANPHVKAYRYDPYGKVLTSETYDIDQMKSIRMNAIEKAQQASTFGIILGTLGRQGNTKLLNRVESLLKEKGKKYFILLLSEIFPDKLRLIDGIDAWIQIACPRLSIDWGYAFDKPLLNPYEAQVCLEATEWKQKYPMDYYAKGSGEWTNYFEKTNTQIMTSTDDNHNHNDNDNAAAAASSSVVIHPSP